MNILLTNNRLDFRGGAESFVRNWSRGLRDLGHEVVAYSGDLGPEYHRLEDQGVPVTKDLEHLPFVPDLVHAQHHLDAMAALTALPNVPAIYHCHGAVWQECPPVHPRIYRYLAVSETLAARLAVEYTIAPSRIEVLLNSIDLDRFRTIGTRPARPSRALVFNYRHDDAGETVGAIRTAATRRGLVLDVVGLDRGNWLDEPADVLPGYDIVFASGVSAIEAMASGCAVIVLGRTSCGELVRPGNYDRFRRVNFSVPVNSPPPEGDEIDAQIGLYSATDCAVVSAQIRRDADSRASIRRLETIYCDAIDAHLTSSSPPTLRAELVSASAYLQTLAPVVGMADSMRLGRWAGETSALSNEELRAALAPIAADLDAADSERR